MPEPFLKWPGGKRWLVHAHQHVFPVDCQRYVEPFLGSGAVFFHLHPASSILADTNTELINAYRCIRRRPNAIDKSLRALHGEHSLKLYMRLRAARPKSQMERAVRFIYLNRTCFNGIYRVNQEGDFNVPMGSKSLVEYPAGYLQSVSEALKKARFRVADFAETLAETRKGDFVYVDPPYTVMHNNNNFLRYNANLFSWDDQVRLSESIKKAARRGAKIVLSNADHHSIRALYRDFGLHYSVDRRTSMAADPFHRCKTTELIITNTTGS